MADEKKLIMGVGHKVKSLQNPDKRVTIIKEFAKNNFKDNSLLEYALKVEKITTQKKQSLILNVLFFFLIIKNKVDGCNKYILKKNIRCCLLFC